MRWFPPELDQLLSVAIGTLTADGCLINANDGFLELIRMGGIESPVGTIITGFFLQPNFATIVANQKREKNSELYSGLITVRTYRGQTHCLVSRIWERNGQIRFVAEFNIRELLQLNDFVLELNRDVASAHLETAQANLRLQQREDEIRTLSLTDQLTGIGNRRRLEQALEEEISRAVRSGRKLCALMADLDHFKRVNDTYGHGAGDAVLATFGEILRGNTRKSDVLGRYGGEEFVILMSDTGLEQAVQSAERLRMKLATTVIAPLPEPITVSIGVVEFDFVESVAAFLRRVDGALYQAKHNGRNRVLAA